MVQNLKWGSFLLFNENRLKGSKSRQNFHQQLTILFVKNSQKLYKSKIKVVGNFQNVLDFHTNYWYGIAICYFFT